MTQIEPMTRLPQLAERRSLPAAFAAAWPSTSPAAEHLKIGALGCLPYERRLPRRDDVDTALSSRAGARL